MSTNQQAQGLGSHHYYNDKDTVMNVNNNYKLNKETPLLIDSQHGNFHFHIHIHTNNPNEFEVVGDWSNLNNNNNNNKNNINTELSGNWANLDNNQPELMFNAQNENNNNNKPTQSSIFSSFSSKQYEDNNNNTHDNRQWEGINNNNNNNNRQWEDINNNNNNINDDIIDPSTQQSTVYDVLSNILSRYGYDSNNPLFQNECRKELEGKEFKRRYGRYNERIKIDGLDFSKNENSLIIAYAYDESKKSSRKQLLETQYNLMVNKSEICLIKDSKGSLFLPQFACLLKPPILNKNRKRKMLTNNEDNEIYNWCQILQPARKRVKVSLPNNNIKINNKNNNIERNDKNNSCNNDNVSDEDIEKDVKCIKKDIFISKTYGNSPTWPSEREVKQWFYNSYNGMKQVRCKINNCGKMYGGKDPLKGWRKHYNNKHT